MDLGAPLFRAIDPKLSVTFDVGNLVSRRSVVFARAGYGKSNLMKYLISELYRSPPTTPTGLGVGTLIFDPDGEYFWPDRVRGRPGLCDVPHLRDRLVVFTNRKPANGYYGSFKAGQVKLDIRDLPARDVIGIAVSAERQTQQNVLKLKSVSQANWRDLVDLIFSQGLQASDGDVGRLLGYPANQIQQTAAEIGAARSNMFGVVRMLHDPGSRVLSGALESLRQGAVVVIDISLLSSSAGNMLSGLILRRLFSHNQENFTGGDPIIPVIAIVEEAQSVLGRNLDESSPFVEWVKEGRKYELGAILITQQPGSMAPELLSQADNWFCFHLLAEGDASTLGRYNSHFSDDVLAHLIGEPIRGNCFMWSAPLQPFVLPVRIKDFETSYATHIRSSVTEPPLAETMATRVVAAVAGAHQRLAGTLSQALAGRNVKWVRLSMATLPSGEVAIGIYSGQLYHIIEGIRTDSDIESAEQLKLPLLSLLLGEGCVHMLNEAGKDYFCAAQAAWEAALGFQLQVR